MKKEDLAKIDSKLCDRLTDKYILQCLRFPIEPREFVNDERQIGDDSVALACVKIYKDLKKYFADI